MSDLKIFEFINSLAGSNFVLDAAGIFFAEGALWLLSLWYGTAMLSGGKPVERIRNACIPIFALITVYLLNRIIGFFGLSPDPLWRGMQLSLSTNLLFQMPSLRITVHWLLLWLFFLRTQPGWDS
jgi:hypothetical protein